ncbi:hypothetical protein D1007_43036 [Hordeum vulgare]|nr:hypothetical protein D1007_43036 [Hordeum vulgare]
MSQLAVFNYAHPKELKRHRNKEYYARNKDDILKRRREARENKHGSTPMLTDQQNETNTPLYMSRAVDPIELQRQMVGEHYSHNVDDVFSAQLQAEQENETQTPVSMPIDPKELRRQRDRERYAQNRDEILKRQCISREKRNTATRLLNDDTTVSHTSATGQTGVTQLQNLTCAVTIVEEIVNCSSNMPKPMVTDVVLILCRRLIKNDAYQRQQRPGSSKIAIVVPLGEGPLTHISEFDVPKLSILHGKDCTIEDAGEDQNADPYGIFEPVVEHTSLQDCLDPLHTGEPAYHELDEEARIYMDQDVAFESFQDGRYYRSSTRSKY